MLSHSYLGDTRKPCVSKNREVRPLGFENRQTDDSTPKAREPLGLPRVHLTLYSRKQCLHTYKTQKNGRSLTKIARYQEFACSAFQLGKQARANPEGGLQSMFINHRDS